MLSEHEADENTLDRFGVATTHPKVDRVARADQGRARLASPGHHRDQRRQPSRSGSPLDADQTAPDFGSGVPRSTRSV
jgi:hypothetical protein